MNPVISDVRQTQHEIARGLPLHVQHPVFRIRERIAWIVASELQRSAKALIGGDAEWRRQIFQLIDIRNQRSYSGKVGWGRWRGRGTKGHGERRRGRSQKWHHERLLSSDAKRTTNALPGAGRKLCEILAPVVVNTKTGAYHEVLDERWSPGDSNARTKTPLPSGQRRITNPFCAESFVVTRDDQTNICDRVRGRVVVVILWVEIG